jgi:hypothetical protein
MPAVRYSPIAHPEAGRDGVGDALLGVVRVDGEDGVAGHDLGPRVERRLLVGERQDPGVGAATDAEQAPARHVQVAEQPPR